VEDIHKLQDKFGAYISFLAIYIVEAHAIDEWPVGDPLKVTQPKTIAERCGVARAFMSEYKLKLPMFVDQLDNNFSDKFAGWPVRFYVVQKEKSEKGDLNKWKMVFKAQPDHKNTYDSVPKQLDNYLSTVKR